MKLDTVAQLHSEQLRQALGDLAIPDIERITGQQAPKLLSSASSVPAGREQIAHRQRPKWTVAIAAGLVVVVLGSIPVVLLAGGESDNTDSATGREELLGTWNLVELDSQPALAAFDGRPVSITFTLEPDWAPPVTDAAGVELPRGFAFTGFAGCNGFFGRWDLEGEKLVFRGASATLVGCGGFALKDDEYRARQDQELRILGCMVNGTSAWEIDGTALRLSKDDLTGLQTCTGEGKLDAVFEQVDEAGTSGQ